MAASTRAASMRGGSSGIAAMRSIRSCARSGCGAEAAASADEVTNPEETAPTTNAGQQVMKGVIYSDASEKPEKLLAVSEQLTVTGPVSEGWYELPFKSPVNLSPGNYWIGTISGATNEVAGFRFDKVEASRAWNANTYSSGPSNVFGAATVDGKQMSLYATYTPG